MKHKQEAFVEAKRGFSEVPEMSSVILAFHSFTFFFLRFSLFYCFEMNKE